MFSIKADTEISRPMDAEVHLSSLGWSVISSVMLGERKTLMTTS